MTAGGEGRSSGVQSHMLKRLIIRWRFRHMTKRFDTMISEARRRHMPVSHLQQAKSDFVHAQLRKEVAGPHA